MSLYQQLQTAKSEEDVKDAYVKALEASGKESGNEFDFSAFKVVYDALSEKLRPMVYELGFLK